jgi:hypothetical protein
MFAAEKMKMMDTNHAGESDGRPETSILIGEGRNGRRRGLLTVKNQEAKIPVTGVHSQIFSLNYHRIFVRRFLFSDSLL